MYNVLALNKIAACGLNNFDKDKYTVSDNCENPDAIILRSFSMHEMELPPSLKAVARAGAGVNNIPIDKCSEKGIVVFNTPGANANAVKELTILGLLLASRDVVDGVVWAKTLKGNGSEVGKMVEKGKSNYAGNEIENKKLAVIGLGAIGVMVANAAYSLGMDVIGYDPYISVKSALGLSRKVHFVNDLKEAVKDADYISIHVPLMDSTKGMFNKELFDAVKKGVKLLNFSRDAIVDNESIKYAIENGIVSKYVTDFPNDFILGLDNVIAIPHLGASSQESEDNCAVMAAKELVDYLENGNIVNSVNFPNCELPRVAPSRLVVLHKNIPNMITQIGGVISKDGLNIANMINKSNNEYACTLVEIDADVSENIKHDVESIDGIISVRIIK